MKKINKRALRRSMWGSLSRVISVALGAGAGSMIHRAVGESLSGYSVASLMAISSFALMWFSEYERET